MHCSNDCMEGNNCSGPIACAFCGKECCPDNMVIDDYDDDWYCIPCHEEMLQFRKSEQCSMYDTANCSCGNCGGPIYCDRCGEEVCPQVDQDTYHDGMDYCRSCREQLGIKTNEKESDK